MKKYPYPALEAKPKTGDEIFSFKDRPLDFQLIDFWRWNQSCLLENRTRGILSEFLVMKALDIPLAVRSEWEDFDILTAEGDKIEVKSSAYIQSWEQERLSKIIFSIRPTRYYADNEQKRRSDFYVFCVLAEKDQSRINPMDLSQWDFYVLPTPELNRLAGRQKTISLNALLGLNPVKCDFFGLKEALKTAKSRDI